MLLITLVIDFSLCISNAACHSEVETIVSLATNHNVVIIPFGGELSFVIFTVSIIMNYKLNVLMV